MKADKVAWVEEKKNLMKWLVQSEGQVHLLQGGMETHGCELAELCDKVCRAQEAKNKDDFNLRLLELKRNSVVSHLSKAQEALSLN